MASGVVGRRWVEVLKTLSPLQAIAMEGWRFLLGAWTTRSGTSGKPHRMASGVVGGRWVEGLTTLLPLVAIAMEDWRFLLGAWTTRSGTSGKPHRMASGAVGFHLAARSPTCSL